MSRWTSCRSARWSCSHLSELKCAHSSIVLNVSTGVKMARTMPGGRHLALNHRGIKKFLASGRALPIPTMIGKSNVVSGRRSRRKEPSLLKVLLTSISVFDDSLAPFSALMYNTDFPHDLHRFALNPTYSRTSTSIEWRFRPLAR